MKESHGEQLAKLRYETSQRDFKIHNGEQLTNRLNCRGSVPFPKGHHTRHR